MEPEKLEQEELAVESEVSEEETEQQESDEPTEDIAAGSDDGDESEEIVVSIGDEPPPEEDQNKAPEWVRDLRKDYRSSQKRIKELEAQLQSTQDSTKPALGEKPTLEQFDYDTDEYEGALAEWYERKRLHDDEIAKQKQAEEQAQEQWQARLAFYAEEKDKLKVPDYDDAEAVIENTMSQTQQGIILQGADNPALLVYALGKNPKRAQDLAKLQDTVQFIFAVAKLEKDLKVSSKRTPPPPEKPISASSGISSAAIDSQLDRLRAEAEKTGDYSKVMAYKRKKKAQ